MPPAELPGLNGLLTLAVGVVVIAALYVGREVLIPITLAVLLSFVLAPLVDLLRRAYLGRVPSVILAVLLAFAIMLGLGGLIGTQVADLARGLPTYAATVESKVEAVRDAVQQRFTQMLRSFGQERHGAAQPNPGSAPAPAGQPPPVPVQVQQPVPGPFELGQRFLSPVLSPLETTAIVIVVAIFILLQREDLRDRIIRLFGSRDLHRTTAAMDDAASRLSRYFLTQLAVNTGFGCIIGFGLYFIGIPSPLLFGVMAGLLRFVPYIGTWMAAAIPVVFAAAVDPGWSMVLWTALLFVFVEPMVGQVLEPMLYGHSTGLSPFSVVVAAIFWTWLWGPIGLIMSTPLTLCLVVLGRHVERLEFLDVLLGDRPALTPVESLYQRILAGDPDEAAEQAELLLKERSLSSYYDEVALRALQLAASDSRRGVLSPQGIEQILEATEELVENLSDHPDTEPAPEKAAVEPVAPSSLAEQDFPKRPPPPVLNKDELPPGWQSEKPVLCIAGRSPLDAGAAAMLAQLLEKHGLGARLVRAHKVSRAEIASLDVEGVAMVCISYLEVSGAPSHLRYFLRRIRSRAPNAPILVALWGRGEEVRPDSRLAAAIGGDYYASTLREAVELCVQTALRAAEPARTAVAAAE
ncbi:MAG: AI-2E family transporter [Acetobacteraceae bacterium]|nr:AI-2E family transporter [Acetobacteraceae bacterium]